MKTLNNIVSTLFGITLLAGCSGASAVKYGKQDLLLHKLEYRDYSVLERKIDRINIGDLILQQPACGYNSAAELMATCPTRDEIQEIRNDFNIWFDRELVENGTLVPWSCTDGGDESSLMLSMYNSFRLMKCIPFDATFPWATEHNNLYDWLKGADLTSIGYFWAEQGEYSHAWNNQIFLTANFLTEPRYRTVIDPQSGVGLIHAVILIAHEARHVEANIGHNCGYKDTNLEYGGAWSVQYYLEKMLAENTGNYFTDYEISMLLGSSQSIYNTRFCDW